MRVYACVVGLVVGFMACGARAQEGAAADAFSRKNTWTVFAEYSDNSSHILMGRSRQRKMADLGGEYARRLAHSRNMALSYMAEVRPVLFESDPVMIERITYTFATPPPIGSQTGTSTAVTAVGPPCTPSTVSFTDPGIGNYPSETITINNTCGRQWTFGQVFQPVGFTYSVRTQHRLQPFAVGTLGYMYTSRPVPVSNAEAFNFVFDVGVGIELYREGKKSAAVECLYQHFSNKNTAEANPGVDSVMFRALYSFGR